MKKETKDKLKQKFKESLGRDAKVSEIENDALALAKLAIEEIEDIREIIKKMVK